MAPTSPRGAPGVVGAGNTLTPDQVNQTQQLVGQQLEQQLGYSQQPVQLQPASALQQ